MYMAIFNTVAPVTVCALVGYFWARRGLAYETAFVTRMVTYVGFPCLIFKTLITVELQAEALIHMGGLALLTTAAFALIAAPVLRLAGLDLRAFLPAMTFANTGNLGLSLCLLAFGEPGLALAIGYFTVSSILVFLLGPAIASGNFTATSILKVPMVWSVLSAIIVKSIGVAMPQWVLSSLDLLGGFAIPLMLITLGVSLADLKGGNLGRGFALSLFRLGMGFGVGWATAEFFGLSGIARGVVIIECAMPVAVFNYVYAEMYRTRPTEVAGTVMVSTLLSFATLPALMWFVMHG